MRGGTLGLVEGNFLGLILVVLRVYFTSISEKLLDIRWLQCSLTLETLFSPLLNVLFTHNYYTSPPPPPPPSSHLSFSVISLAPPTIPPSPSLHPLQTSPSPLPSRLITPEVVQLVAR